MMSLFDKIIEIYPELTIDDFDPQNGIINLRNDADGKGDYISKWEYDKPIPENMQIGK